MSIKVVFLLFTGIIAVQSAFDFGGLSAQQGYSQEQYQPMSSNFNFNGNPQYAQQELKPMSFLRTLWYRILSTIHLITKPLQILFYPIRAPLYLFLGIIRPLKTIVRSMWHGIWNIINMIPVVRIPANIVRFFIKIALSPIKMIKDVLSAIFLKKPHLY